MEHNQQSLVINDDTPNPFSAVKKGSKAELVLNTIIPLSAFAFMMALTIWSFLISIEQPLRWSLF